MDDKQTQQSYWCDGLETASSAAVRDKIIFVMVRPSLSENVGAATRALANMGFAHLRVVAMEHFDRSRAEALAVSAAPRLDKITFFPTLEEALVDTVRVFAVTRRRRRRRYTSVSSRQAGALVADAVAAGPVALLFGCEQDGLTNDEMRLAHELVTIPTAGELDSLNLAQAIMVMAYELFQTTVAVPKVIRDERFPPAPLVEVGAMLDHMERALWQVGFIKESNRVIIEDLLEIFRIPNMTSPQVRILRGIFSAVESAAQRDGDGGA